MQLRLNKEQRDLYDLVDETARCIEMRRGVRLSGHTRVLIAILISAIKEDPPLQWNTNEIGREVSYKEIQRTLSTKFEQLVGEIGNNVTFFDVLRWVSENLDSIYPAPFSPEITSNKPVPH